MGVDAKISEYSSLTGANSASGDLIEIADISEAADADKNKSITMDELRNAMMPVHAAYTPVFSAGWGTMSASRYLWVLHNSVMTIWGQHNNGTPSAVALTIGLPIGYKVHTDIVLPQFLGLIQRNAWTSARYGVLGMGGDIFLEVSRLDAAGTTDSYTPMLGNSGMGANENQSFSISVLVEAV